MKKRILRSAAAVLAALTAGIMLCGMPVLPVQAANDSFVGRGNLTEDEMHWVNDISRAKRSKQRMGSFYTKSGAILLCVLL